MKSHANKIKLNELFSFLNVDLGDHSNSLELNDRIVKSDAIWTKLGGKTYILILIWFDLILPFFKIDYDILCAYEQMDKNILYTRYGSCTKCPHKWIKLHDYNTVSGGITIKR